MKRRNKTTGPAGKPLKSLKKGQAALEYVLLVAVSSLIFGAMFTAIRQSMYRIWVCEVGPRVQSPTGCNNTQDCWTAVQLGANARESLRPPGCDQ